MKKHEDDDGHGHDAFGGNKQQEEIQTQLESSLMTTTTQGYDDDEEQQQQQMKQKQVHTSSTISICSDFSKYLFMSQQRVQAFVDAQLSMAELINERNSASGIATTSTFDNDNDDSDKHGFASLISNLIGYADKHNEKVLTFQIGGMDGQSNDPFYKMTKKRTELKSWIPIVIEPIDTNFHALQSTYEEHVAWKELQCYVLMKQVISYGSIRKNKRIDSGKKEGTEGEDEQSQHVHDMCNFCTFNEQKVECQDRPEWVKYQLGTLALCYQRLRNPCFKMESYPCSTISMALADIGLSAKHIAVLQLDVEGAEMEILEGFLSETSPSDYPPIIHFEVKILKGSLGAEEQTFRMLRTRGYQIHYDTGDEDALAILQVHH